MRANKYLIIPNIIIIIICVTFYILNDMRTGLYEKALGDAYVRGRIGGTLDYLKIMDLDANVGKAKVFMVENMPTVENGKKNFNKTYQVGRMMEFRQNLKTNEWHSKSGTIKPYWSDRKKKGNEFTFPLYIGKDWTIVLKR
ncbi:MAG: hypothetical protein K8T10_09670 [Candidatus Eremiobacteraeota bacterium]|nr:hypothetical protein [Candidatus Eremiobacteraeota bacterium]